MDSVTERVVNACYRSTILAVQFIVQDAAALMAKLGTRRSTSVYKGEWAYHIGSEAFKDKSRLKLHSKNFDFQIVLFVRY